MLEVQNMPKQAKGSTLLRQWEMLKVLPAYKSSNHNSHDWMPTKTIVEKLQDKEFSVSVRTVQRDLLELSHIFPIESNTKNPRDYGWRWAKSAGFGIAGMASSEALSLSMVEMYLEPLMPLSIRKELEPFFNMARNFLENETLTRTNKKKYWLDKVRVVNPAQYFIAPSIDPEIYEKICRALMHEKQLDVAYQAFGSDAPKNYAINPLGLIMRGNIFYVAATAKDYIDVGLYAVHRFKEAYVSTKKLITPKDFDLDKAIENGLAGFMQNPEKITLKILCDKDLADHLLEMPFSENQIQTPQNDNQVLVTATTNNTWQLHWWLMSQGKKLEVCKPEKLRKEIIKDLRAALARYGQ